MKAHVQKWGNSLALRIPNRFAQEVGLEPDSEVDVPVENGKIVITPANITLDDLLAAITDSNLHSEISPGAPAGVEVW